MLKIMSVVIHGKIFTFAHKDHKKSSTASQGRFCDVNGITWWGFRLQVISKHWPLPISDHCFASQATGLKLRGHAQHCFCLSSLQPSHFVLPHYCFITVDLHIPLRLLCQQYKTYDNIKSVSFVWLLASGSSEGSCIVGFLQNPCLEITCFC